MKKFKSFLSAIVVMAMFTACGRNNGDDPTICPNPNPGNNDFHGVVFATGITNPEGNSGNVYLQALQCLQIYITTITLWIGNSRCEDNSMEVIITRIRIRTNCWVVTIVSSTSGKHSHHNNG